jgi:hypothetical protein
MKLKDLPKGTKIDPLDIGSRVFVWMITSDGSRVLYGVNRLCKEYRLKTSTFWYRWTLAGTPDEVDLSMLADPSELIRSKGWEVDGVWYPSHRAIADALGRAESTISARFSALGRRNATSEELALRKNRQSSVNTDPLSGQRVLLMPDGSHLTFSELKSISDVSEMELRRRAKKNGFVLHRDDLKRKSKDPFTTNKFSVSPRNIDDVEYRPSALERSISRL